MHGFCKLLLYDLRSPNDTTKDYTNSFLLMCIHGGGGGVVLFVFETGSHYVAKANGKLVSSNDPLTSAPQVAGTIGTYHLVSYTNFFFKTKEGGAAESGC